MEESLDLLFERYRRTGDPDLLAQVFDRTAPRLLRAAVHLTGEMASAEDLVQSTFVTAIERAGTWDARRPLEAWLTGILGNKAREARKREAREIDVDRLAAREAERPDDEAGVRETSAALVKAIDELPESYRQPLLLRLRHGLGPAEIAHVLGESPGAIRVRLHRGIEKLRKLLPAGIVASALFVARPTRGLAAVREIVVAHAGSFPIAVGTGSVLGGVLAVKKLMIAGVALVLAVLFLVGASRLWRSEGLVAEKLVSSTALLPERVGDVGNEPAIGMETTPSPGERVSASTGGDEKEFLEGRVIDVETRSAIPGAIIDVYPPRRARLSEVQRRWPDRVLRPGGGTLQAADSWPWVSRELSDAARGDLEDVLVLDAPMPDAVPITTVASDAEGRFAIPKDAVPGFLVCRAEPFATRYRPIHEASEPVMVWMSKPWKLEGHVIDTEGRRIERSIRLAFTAWEPPLELPPTKPYPAVGMGLWVTTTRADGSFEVEVAAAGVHARSREPGILLVTVGKDPNGDGRWVYVTSFNRDSARPAVLVASSPPVLLVRDAQTKEPIEDFRMSSIAEGRSRAQWIGPMWAPQGRLMLVDSDPDDSPFTKSEVSAAQTFQIWADGYLPARIELPNLLAAGEIAVDLVRGETPGLDGVVLRNGTPIEGATVALLSTDKFWREDEEGLVAAARTDTNGMFRVEAPEGAYVLRTTVGDQASCRSVRIPSVEPIRIDIGTEASVHVRLRGEDGAGKSNHVVALHGDDGSTRVAHTDEAGLARFSHLSASEYKVHVPYKTTESSFVADVVRRLSLAEGERAEVEIVFPDLGPRHSRLVVDGDAPGPGWRAHNRSHPGDEAVDVSIGGTIPIEIQFGVRVLEVQGSDGRVWTFPIPYDAPDGFELRVELDGLAYEGTLLAADGDEPIAKVFVCASPDQVGAGRHRSYRALTDSRGHFRISGLEPGAYRLWFQSKERATWANDLAGMSFMPSDPPSENPRPLIIRLPRAVEGRPDESSTCEISGTARLAGATAVDKTVSISSWIAADGGSLVLSTLAAEGETDVEGRFRVRVRRSSRYSALLYAEDERIWGPVAIDADPAAASIERDLDFP